MPKSLNDEVASYVVPFPEVIDVVDVLSFLFRASIDVGRVLKDEGRILDRRVYFLKPRGMKSVKGVINLPAAKCEQSFEVFEHTS